MKEKIGDVTLNYEFYEGRDFYNDGDAVEEQLLNICKSGKVKEALRESDLWPVLYHLSDIRGNIIEWYPFEENASILEIGSGCGAISGFLCKKAEKVIGIELSKRRSLINAYRNRECGNLEIYVGNFSNIKLKEKFDYITLIGVLEYAASYTEGNMPFQDMLKNIQKYLKPNGKIIIAIENKMGMKYLNGAKEDHIGEAFVGIEDYKGISNVRTFSKPELCQLLESVGICEYKFYYPSPDYKLPDSIYSDAYMPGIGEIRVWGKNYDNVRLALYNDAIVADQICKDNMFAYFSNSFLVICNEKANDYEYIHYTGVRNEEYQTKTVIIEEDGRKNVKKEYLKKVQKRSFDIFNQMRESYEILDKEFTNTRYLKPEVSKNEMKYGYLNGLSLDVILFNKIHFMDELILDFKKMINTYFAVNESYSIDFKVTDDYKKFFGDYYVATNEKSLKVTNIDMILQNLIMMDNQVFCIDYEWVFDFPIPFEFVVYRCVEMFYSKYNMYFSPNYNFHYLLLAVGVKKENIAVYEQMARFFYHKISGDGSIDHYKKASGMLKMPVIK